MADYIDWPGKSGKTYRYWFGTELTPSMKKESGNYTWVKRLPNGNWLPVYFGEAADLDARISSHERADDARRAGATHIMSHTTPAGEQARLDEERDLIAYWNPVLNTQHKQVK